MIGRRVPAYANDHRWSPKISMVNSTVPPSHCEPKDLNLLTVSDIPESEAIIWLFVPNNMYIQV